MLMCVYQAFSFYGKRHCERASELTGIPVALSGIQNNGKDSARCF